MKSFVATLVFSAILLGPSQTVLAADHFKMLDVKVGDQRYAGRVLIHNGEFCWLLQPDGRLQQFATEQVTDFVELKDRFKAKSNRQIQEQLQAEFGPSFEVRTSNHYVVVARSGSAKAYAALFERIYMDFTLAFRARGLHVVEPEFPLVAIVFPNQTSFLDYCKTENAQVPSAVVGCYLHSSNRVAMYERATAEEIDGTVIHEATHQVAFNTGVHSRVAKHPQWVVEGLATVFEAEGTRNRQGTNKPLDRVNRERYLWFDEYSKNRRPNKSLRDFIREDKLFQAATLDAYSEAWALSFFLLETRSAEYSRYLKKLAERDPLKQYEANAREKDFTAAFGHDLPKVESSYLAFMRGIQTVRSASGGR
jgi:hypothetical protein